MSGLTGFRSIPEVDLRRLRDPSAPGYAGAVVDLARACREVGFLHLVGHGIPERTFDELRSAAQEFFELPTEQKMRSYIGLSRNHRGYVPPGEEGPDASAEPDHKEAFDSALDLPADDPDHLAGNPMLGPNVWPDLAGFKEAVTAYYTAAIEVGHVLFRALADALGEPSGAFVARARKAPSQLRLIHYGYDADAVDRAGIGAHTDYECFTLLRPTAPGLEVLNGNGEWVEVPMRDDALVVNIGDLMEIWSCGEFVATTHRVRKVKEERYSFPLFFCVDYDTVVSPLPQCVGDARQYPTVVAGEHLYAQTVQTFAYLRKRVEAGEATLPAGALATASFGQGARHPDA